MRGGNSVMFAVIGMLACTLVFTGCFGKFKTVNRPETPTATGTDGENNTTGQPGTGDPAGAEGVKADYDPGKLVGVRFESSGGSMNPFSEFEIDVNENEIVSTFYYSNYYSDDLEYELGDEKLAELDEIGRVDKEKNSWDENRVDRKNVPVDKKLWNVLTEEFEYLKPKLKECPETTKEDIHKRDEELQVLDGGDYELLHLTWEKNGETRTVQYYFLGGRRWNTIYRTLHEMVRPVGRDLSRIGETHITQMLLKTKDYSYQISPVKDEDKYYYFAYDEKNRSTKLKAKQWLVVRDHLETMDFSGFETGGYSDKMSLKIEYNDGDYFYYLIDKKTADELKQFILDQGF